MVDMRFECERRSKYVQVEDSVPARCKSVIGAIHYGGCGGRKYVEEIELFNPLRKLKNKSFSLSHPSFFQLLISGGHRGEAFLCGEHHFHPSFVPSILRVYDE